MDLQRTIDTFLIYMSGNGYSKSTEGIYSWALNLLNHYLENPDIKAIKQNDMDRFWSWLRNDYKPTRMNGKKDPLYGPSLENVWTAERTFFKWCQETDRIKKRPDLHIRKPEYAERVIEPVSDNDIERLLEAAQRTRIAKTADRAAYTMPRSTAKRDTAIIMLLGETGIRVSECARLVRSDIDWNESTITIQPFGTGRKTKYRVLDIGKKTRMALWDYLMWREEKEKRTIDDDETVFRSLVGNPMNKDSIRQVIDEISKSAGIGHVHPHQFRHFFTSVNAANDMGQEELKEKLGNTSDKAVKRLYPPSFRKKKKTREHY
jgi:integrase